MTPPLAPEHVLIFALAILAGAFVTGFAGFGLAAVAGAILLHLQPPALAIPLLMICSIPSQVLGLLSLRAAIEWRISGGFVLGGLAGAPIAATVFHRLDSEVLADIFGTALVLYAGYAALFGRRASAPAPLAAATAGLPAVPGLKPPRILPIFSLSPALIGAGAGFVGGLTAMPSLLVTVWCDATGKTKERQRGITQPFILVMQFAALAAMARAPDFPSPALLQLSAVALPLVLLGTAAGILLFRRVNCAMFRSAVLALVFVSGLGLISG